ncbi:unnamed protein product [Adineta steineri]|uniref:ZZ-type domain-containing protein n=1 Tax=Adineta steineri TaxID=433720 RepID=A0A815ZJQ1_9BILA|nr:unnamed protein product [Adineta steineri]CAF1584379.1 unnamed protein product [Adineta steineri]
MSKNSSKLIFSRSSYQERVLGFCDICYNIIDLDKKLYYECQNCQDFLACRHCVQSNRHKNHPAHHSFAVALLPPDDHWIHMNLGISCDICFRQNFTGKRYQCQTCLPSISFDVCSSCLPKVDLFHPKHKLIFVPNAIKIHANRIVLATRAIKILNAAEYNGIDLDDATGWRLSDAQTVLAVNMLELQKLINAVSALSLSDSLSDESELNSCSDTSLQEYSQSFVEDPMLTYLKNVQKEMASLDVASYLNGLQEEMASLSVSPPVEKRLETHMSPDFSSSLDYNQWMLGFLEQQRKTLEVQKEEDEKQDRIRQKVIHDKIIHDNIIRDERLKKFHIDKHYENERINKQYQTANRLDQERRLQSHLENERVTQASRMAAIQQQQILDDAIQQQIRQQQILDDGIRQQQIRDDAIRQQWR